MVYIGQSHLQMDDDDDDDDDDWVFPVPPWNPQKYLLILWPYLGDVPLPSMAKVCRCVLDPFQGAGDG